MSINIEPINYQLPDPPSILKHKKRNFFEWLVSLLMSSHVCQICKRKEIWSISGWFQIDDPKHKDRNGCSVVCVECRKANSQV